MASGLRIEGFIADSEVGAGLSYNGCVRIESQREGRRGSPTPGTLTVFTQTVPDIQPMTLKRPASVSQFGITGTSVRYFKVSARMTLAF